MSKKGSFLFFVLFFIILFVSGFIGDIYRYGTHIALIFFVFLLAFNPLKLSLNIVTVVSMMFIPVLLLSPFDFISFASEFLTLFCLLSFIKIGKNAVLSTKQKRCLIIFVFVYIILFYVFMADSTRYSGTRYNGLLPSDTVSSNVVVCFLIYLLEHYRFSEKRGKIFIMSCFVFVTLVLVCNTRSVLIFLPYLAYYFSNISNSRKTKFIFFGGAILLLLFVYKYLTQNAETLRLSTEENSFMTRAMLYEDEFRKIKEAYYILPHGFDACRRYIQSSLSEEWSPHNDFLKYWYDWGVVWIIALPLFFYKAYKFGKQYACTIRVFLILLFVSSCALHNILLSFYIWPILALVMYELRANFYYQHEQ